MKTIGIGKFVIDVDTEKTLEHSKTIERCYCLPCQNFRKQIENYNKKLNEFLWLFGIDITCPEKLVWLDSDKTEQTVQCFAYYSVYGIVKEFDEYEIDIDNLSVEILKPDSSQINTDISEPYFIISVNNIFLDWLMEEDYENVFLAENEKKRNKMLNKIYKKSLSFGKDWLKPINVIVEKAYPKLPLEEKNKLAQTVENSRSKIFGFIYDNYIYNNEKNDMILEKSAIDLIKNNYPWMNNKNIRYSINQGFYYAWHG